MKAKDTIEVTKKDLEAYEYAINHQFTNTPIQPTSLSWLRLELTHLDINKYIYIHDHYKELKRSVKK